MDIQFHCDEGANFPRREQMVRAFNYTDYSIEPHNHDFYEMNIVLGGKGTHLIETAAFPVRRGDVFVIPPMTVHAYEGTESLEVCHVLFKKEFIRKNSKESSEVRGFAQLVEIEPFLRKSGSSAMFLRLDAAQLARVQEDIRIIRDGSEFDGTPHYPMCNHTAWKMLYYLSHLLSNQTEHSGRETAKYEGSVLDTLEYIHGHFSEKITVELLAARLFLSRSTFLRNFSAVCGCSPIQYLNAHRVKKAKELMASSDMSKTEIAHACGFYDLSHMEKILKRSE
ncbi:MAG: helix-turn-helix domain-containing protein [Ruminococcaceae bacterium]|nr:helix-turn-helix domain-containing protein [Oscillospiraceae bacterium]